MTDNEILKQLETCTYYPNCPECPYYDKSDIAHECMVGVMRKAYGLIKRQQEKIKELEAEINQQYEQAVADIRGIIADGGTSCHWCIQQNKTEAIKEFADRLKSKTYIMAEYDESGCSCAVYVVKTEEIDNLVKEMVGGSDESI